MGVISVVVQLSRLQDKTRQLTQQFENESNQQQQRRRRPRPTMIRRACRKHRPFHSTLHHRSHCYTPHILLICKEIRNYKNADIADKPRDAFVKYAMV